MNNTDMERDSDQLRAQLAEATKDKERLDATLTEKMIEHLYWARLRCGKSIDRTAIDAAMKGGTK